MNNRPLSQIEIVDLVLKWPRPPLIDMIVTASTPAMGITICVVLIPRGVICSAHFSLLRPPTEAVVEDAIKTLIREAYQCRDDDPLSIDEILDASMVRKGRGR